MGIFSTPWLARCQSLASLFLFWGKIMELNEDTRFIWDFFRQKGLTVFGVAGLMGNLYAESGLKSNVVETLCIRRYAVEKDKTYTNETYTQAVDDGSLTKVDFLDPCGRHYGYGLAQWTTELRKSGLYDYCKAQNVSIGNLQAQCEYLYSELENGFKSTLSVLKTAQDTNTASDYVLLHFEMPAEAQRHINIRRRYSNEIFDLLGKEKTMVIIGSARIDENGNSHGGKAGDQTGNEVGIQEYYTHSKGWYVIRANSDTVRERIAQNMEWACANDKIGYDQYQRDTLFSIVKPLGFDCSKVTTACETDCSALVRVCVNYGGIGVGDFNTASEVSTLVNTGAFKVVNVSLPYGLKRGDILVTKTKGHTVVALTNGDGTTGKEARTDSTSDKKYTIGWHLDAKGWWYADSENTYLRETWQLIGHHWYYFGSDGYMLTGWQTIKGKMYYLQESNSGNLQGALWQSDESGAQSVWYVG